MRFSRGTRSKNNSRFTTSTNNNESLRDSLLLEDISYTNTSSRQILSRAPDPDFQTPRLMGSPNTKRRKMSLEDNKHESFDRYTLGADIAAAQIHWDACGLGEKTSTVCKSSLKRVKIPLKLTTSNFKLSSFPSSTIPLYFLNVQFSILFLIVVGLGMLKYALAVHQIYCEDLSGIEGASAQGGCSVFTFSAWYYYSGAFRKRNSLKLNQAAQDNFWFQAASILILYLVVFGMGVIQRKIVRFYDENDLKSPRRFAIMLKKVNKNVEFEQILDFFNHLLLKMQTTPIRSLRINIASYEGYSNEFDQKLQRLKEELETLEYTAETHGLGDDFLGSKKDKRSGAGRGKLNKGGDLAKHFKNKKKRLVKEIKRVRKAKKNWLKDLWKINISRKNCVAFVEIPTNYERDVILASYQKSYSKNSLLGLVLSLFRKKGVFDLEAACEPSQVCWENIGISPKEKILTSALATLVTLTVVPAAYIFLVVAESSVTVEQLSDSLTLQILLLIFQMICLSGFGYAAGLLYNLAATIIKPIIKVEILASKAVVLGYARFLLLFVLVMYQRQKFRTALGSGSGEMLFFVFGSIVLDLLGTPFAPVLNFETITKLLKITSIKGKASRVSSDEDSEDNEGYYRKVKMTQGMLNAIFTRPDPKISSKYSSNLGLLLICATFTPLFPVLPFLGALLLTFRSIFEKYYFFRLMREPPKSTEKVAEGAFRHSLVALKLYLVMVASYSLGGTAPFKSSLVAQVVFWLLLATPQRWILNQVELLYVRNQLEKSKMDLMFYKDYFGQLRSDYDRENPETRAESTDKWFLARNSESLTEMGFETFR